MKLMVIRRAISVLVSIVVLAPSAVSLGGGGFDRYGIIIERLPFGAEALPVVEPVVPPVPPDQSVVNQIRMSAVVRDEAGVLRVGLVDLKTKRNFMLGLGEVVDGVEVVSADYNAERARLRRGPEDYWVSMQGGSNRFERVVPEPTNTPAAQLISSSRDEGALFSGVDKKRSYMLRRQQREESRLRKELERLSALERERAKAAAPAPAADGLAFVAGTGVMRAGRKKTDDTSERTLVNSLTQTENIELTDEEIVRLLQEYQKELIRKGLTPLPIPLTPETDRQLVEEGFLPALE